MTTNDVLVEQLRTDLNTSIKAKDELRKTTLRYVLGEIQAAEKAPKFTPNETFVAQIIAKETKKRRETAAEYRALVQGGEQSGERLAHLVMVSNREEAEADVLAAYLPTQLEDSAVDEIIAKAIAAENATSIKDMGRVMKLVVAEVAGRADGKAVSNKVRAKLA